MKELHKHKEDIKEAYEKAENTDISLRFEEEIVVSENLTVVVEKCMDIENPTIILVFPEDYYNFQGYRTDFEVLSPEIWGIFEEMFSGMFYYCEKTQFDNKYYWIIE